MTKSITTDYLDNSLDNEYIDAEIRVILENHLPQLKKEAKKNVIQVTPAEAYQYDYNYYGLLRKKNIDYRLHWLTLRCNDRIDPSASCKDVREICVPSIEDVNRMLSYWRSTQSKGML